MSLITQILGPTYRRLRQQRSRRYKAWLYNFQRQRYYANAINKPVQSNLKVSILVPAYNPAPAAFEALLSSVFAQSYTNWELVIVDGSSNTEVAAFIARKATSDTRIVYHKGKNLGIGGNTNVAIELATGDVLAFLDHDDTLDANALAYCVEQFEDSPRVGMVYTDHDKLSEDGETYLDPHFKPDWSPDLIRNVNYLTHLVMVRTAIVRELGGIRAGFEGAQDYDFVLRVADTGVQVRHVPRILYHWRLSPASTAALFSNKSLVADAGVKAVAEHYERAHIPHVTAEVIPGRPGWYRPYHLLPKASRAVVLALPVGTPLAVIEFIQRRYERVLSLQKHHIAVVRLADISLTQLATYQTVMVVQDLSIPDGSKAPIDQLFGAAEEPGMFAVSPKLIAGGKIDDMGLIATAPGQLMPLFMGAEPDDHIAFGSYEWVRNVDALSGRVVVTSGKHAAAYIKAVQSGRPRLLEAPADGRLVVWSHVEMLALDDAAQNLTPLSNVPNYFNPNLTYTVAPHTQDKLEVTELMKQGEPND